ncbi:hypothetical protein BDR06DRAFT_1002402 [Suillus hirtellus]|nr:hypothetical protein BDR06DRAFT_1002402 [Suillus hirtellus]
MFKFIGNKHSDASIDGYPNYFANSCSGHVADHGSFLGAQQTDFMDTLYPLNHGPSTIGHASSYQDLIPFNSAWPITHLADLLNSDSDIDWEGLALYANLPPFSELMRKKWQEPNGLPWLPIAHSREELPPTPNMQVPTPSNSTLNSESSSESQPSDIGQTQRQVLDSNTNTITTEAVATGNNSSWAAWNPGQPALTTRQGVKLTDAQKVS